MCSGSMEYAIFALILKPSKKSAMKKLSASVLALSFFYLAGAQNSETPAAQPDPLVLNKTEHDFGKIPQGKPVYYTFEIVNTGTEPVTLLDVHAPCGCTTPEWSREPIAPGATAKIKVGYNAAAEGYFDKSVSIAYNNQTKILRLKGTVWKAPEGPAPSNASIDFLKRQTF